MFKPTAGFVFEVMGHKYIVANTKTLFTIRSLSNMSSEDLDLSHVSGVHKFSLHDQRVDLERVNQYHRPLATNVAGIDAYAFEVSTNNTICGIVFFQFRIAMGHPIHYVFINKLWQMWHRDYRHWTWKLVFVVTEENERDFEEQQWKPSSGANTWKGRVSQYVIGVNAGALWEAMHT
ncbi:uncharacterized protein FOMMEDRAFT_163460 [Fomitiporia mediterranea MF3/22]|uniref:Uncharacterized protein n=1 Tax=Fomitiporia mediterranea (strain MF3/22) TaxID=694068 RepID=R7SGJ6_FOMME|nr:uncharacterized protein FOMMEDRAFT_163460 [Fomitiporia mediterranea MF3/22]EJC97422.1 hypothetical protein FOMMEDRAFT_163460 [Fomitiporia mediterranea MF3/22]